jgi:hypothetical protein
MFFLKDGLTKKVCQVSTWGDDFKPQIWTASVLKTFLILRQKDFWKNSLLKFCELHTITDCVEGLPEIGLSQNCLCLSCDWPTADRSYCMYCTQVYQAEWKKIFQKLFYCLHCRYCCTSITISCWLCAGCVRRRGKQQKEGIFFCLFSSNEPGTGHSVDLIRRGTLQVLIVNHNIQKLFVVLAWFRQTKNCTIVRMFL